MDLSTCEICNQTYTWPEEWHKVGDYHERDGICACEMPTIVQGGIKKGDAFEQRYMKRTHPPIPTQEVES